MDDFSTFGEDNGFRAKLWRGESMCLMGFDVDEPEDDFVGFAVEYKEPGSDTWLNLRNRLTFDTQAGVNGYATPKASKSPNSPSQDKCNPGNRLRNGVAGRA